MAQPLLASVVSTREHSRRSHVVRSGARQGNELDIKYPAQWLAALPGPENPMATNVERTWADPTARTGKSLRLQVVRYLRKVRRGPAVTVYQQTCTDWLVCV